MIMMPFSSQKDNNSNFDDQYIDLLGSKSIINRLLTICLYRNINFTIKNFNLCNDVIEFLNIYNNFHKPYIHSQNDNSLFIQQTSKPFEITETIFLTINESGTTLRFILPFIAFYKHTNKLKSKYLSIITLGNVLKTRPIDSLIQCLNDAGANIEKIDDKIFIKPFINNSKSLKFEIDSSESSQFLSSLLLFSANQNFKIFIKSYNNIASKSYVKTTIKILKILNIDTSLCFYQYAYQANESLLNNNNEFICDPDYSTAPYLFIIGLMTNKKIFIKQSINRLQPDYSFRTTLTKLNCKKINSNHYYCFLQSTIKEVSDLPLVFDFNYMPDQIISLAFLSVLLNKEVIIKGIQTLNQKESKRVNAIIENIKLLGSNAISYGHYIHIIPSTNFPAKCYLKTYNDHRFAMIFVAMQLISKINGNLPEIFIDNTDCIKKSYPNFLTILKSLKFN